jgi:internalin A
MACYAENAPLDGLTALQSLYCRGTQVSDLTPLARLTALQSLNCSNCVLRELPQEVRNLQSLQVLTLLRASIPGIPVEALSQSYGDNCLVAVRAHYRDLEAGSATLTDVKVILLGNGRVGKTQICRRLRGEDYDGDEPSTHGILVTSAHLPPPAQPSEFGRAYARASLIVLCAHQRRRTPRHVRLRG